MRATNERSRVAVEHVNLGAGHVLALEGRAGVGRRRDGGELPLLRDLLRQRLVLAVAQLEAAEVALLARLAGRRRRGSGGGRVGRRSGTEGRKRDVLRERTRDAATPCAGLGLLGFERPNGRLERACRCSIVRRRGGGRRSRLDGRRRLLLDGRLLQRFDCKPRLEKSAKGSLKPVRKQGEGVKAELTLLRLPSLSSLKHLGALLLLLSRLNGPILVSDLAEFRRGLRLGRRNRLLVFRVLLRLERLLDQVGGETACG